MPAGLVAGWTLLWAGLCDLVLEGSLRVGHPSTWTPAITVGILFVWCVVLFLLGLTGRLRFAFAISLAVVAVLGAANLAKLSFLAEPLVPADVEYLRTPGFLVSMVSPRTVALGAAAIALLTAGVLLLGRRLGRRYAPLRRGSRGWRWWTGLRVLLVLGCGALLLQAGSFNHPGNVWRAAYESTDVTWAPWDQLQNYQFNGFVGGALYNLPSVVMAQPEGYDPETMARIADRYRTTPGASPAGRPDPNVVIVLSESFADPQQLAGISLAEDPIPRTRAESARSWGGTALASFYGTGTSAMEFQVLSGQSLGLFEPQITTPYQQFLPGLPDYPTAVGWLASQGYRTVAIHPYSTQMYHRPEVYRVFGFDDFVHDTGLEQVTRIADSPFISDRSAYHEVVHQVEASRDPLLVHLVTMQNHVPMGGSYPDPVGVTGVGGAQADEVGAWARGLSHTDAALPGLLEELEDTGEPTVVVFFGDHFPGIFSDRVQAANPGLAMLETPFFIWSTERGPARHLGVTAPTAFLPLAMERAGVSLPPYYELLRRVADEVGALRGDGVVRPDGREVGYDELTAPQAALVRDLRLVQYDLSVGRRYAVDDLWYPLADRPD